VAYVWVRESRSTLANQLNGNPTLYEDRLTQIKVGILYMKLKSLLLQNLSLCYIFVVICGVCFGARMKQGLSKIKKIKIIKIKITHTIDQKINSSEGLGVLGGFKGCEMFLVIIGESIWIQLT